MTELNSSDDLEKLLKDKDDRICAFIAMRAAMRIIPVLPVPDLELPRLFASDLILKSFLGLSYTWTGLVNSELENPKNTSEVLGNRISGLGRGLADNTYYSAANAIAFAIYSVGDLCKNDLLDGMGVKDTVSRAVFTAADSMETYSENELKKFWHEVLSDASEANDIVALKPLWTEGMPQQLKRKWRNLSGLLIELDEDWQVWTDWYKDRLEGSFTLLGRPVNPELEDARSRIIQEEWEQGPTYVNAIIAELEEEYREQLPTEVEKSIPDQRLAIIEVEIGDDGKLTRKLDDKGIDDLAKLDRLHKAWLAHRDQFNALQSMRPGQNDPILRNILERYDQALGDTYEDLNIIALGIHGERLKAQAKRADEHYLEDIAGELEAMAIAHDLFVRQFIDWRTYKADAQEEPPSNDITEALLEFANKLSHETKVIDVSVLDPLRGLAEDTEAELSVTPEDRSVIPSELLHSEENILAGMLGWAMQKARSAGEVLSNMTVEKIAAIIAIATQTPQLLTKASQWPWVKPAVEYIKKQIGLD